MLKKNYFPIAMTQQNIILSSVNKLGLVMTSQTVHNPDLHDSQQQTHV